MLCSKCHKRPRQPKSTICDICATFNDVTFDLKWEAKKRQGVLVFDEEINNQWQRQSKLSQERIASFTKGVKYARI